MIPIEFLSKMARDTVRNYIVPGLSSSIIGAQHAGGCVRLFQSEREQQIAITPHSHRFNFHCVVLSGKVTNQVWEMHRDGDLFGEVDLTYDALGRYELGEHRLVRRRPRSTVYEAGESYDMTHQDIHSILFGRGANVLFFEGPTLKKKSVILEPVVNGNLVHTFKVEPWMFEKADA